MVTDTDMERSQNQILKPYHLINTLNLNQLGACARISSKNLAELIRYFSINSSHYNHIYGYACSLVLHPHHCSCNQNKIVAIILHFYLYLLDGWEEQVNGIIHTQMERTLHFFTTRRGRKKEDCWSIASSCTRCVFTTLLQSLYGLFLPHCKRTFTSTSLLTYTLSPSLQYSNLHPIFDSPPSCSLNVPKLISRESIDQLLKPSMTQKPILFPEAQR